MTKEAILGYEGYAKDGDELWFKATKVHSAMDQFAKQQAIAFLKFSMGGYIHGDYDGSPFISDFLKSGPSTPDELYTIFLEHQSKQK